MAWEDINRFVGRAKKSFMEKSIIGMDIRFAENTTSGAVNISEVFHQDRRNLRICPIINQDLTGHGLLQVRWVYFCFSKCLEVSKKR